MLQPVARPPGLTMWCGPTAVAAVTGVDYMRACWAIQRTRGWGGVVDWTDTHQLCVALYELGYASRYYTVRRGSTLRRFIREINNVDGCFIMELPGHFAAASYDEYLDNNTDGKPIPICEAPRQRKLVTGLVELRPLSPRRPAAPPGRQRRPLTAAGRPPITRAT